MVSQRRASAEVHRWAMERWPATHPRYSTDFPFDGHLPDGRSRQPGMAWDGEHAGVSFSNPDGQWQKLKSRNPFSQGYISCLFEDSHDNIWVGTVGDGLYRITPQSLAMVKLPPPMDNAEVNTTYVARDGAIWMGTGGSGVVRRDKQGNCTMFGAAQGLDNLHACTVFEDSRTNIWVGTSGGLFRWQDGKICARQFGPPEISRWIKVLFEDRAGRLWIGAIGGLACREQGEFPRSIIFAVRGPRLLRHSPPAWL